MVEKKIRYKGQEPSEPNLYVLGSAYTVSVW